MKLRHAAPLLLVPLALAGCRKKPPANPAPTFNQITAVGDPRTIQLAFRLRF